MGGGESKRFSGYFFSDKREGAALALRRKGSITPCDCKIDVANNWVLLVSMQLFTELPVVLPTNQIATRNHHNFRTNSLLGLATSVFTNYSIVTVLNTVMNNFCHLEYSFWRM